MLLDFKLAVLGACLCHGPRGSPCSCAKMAASAQKMLLQLKQEVTVKALVLFLYFLKRFYLFIFRERGREGERERNISVWLPLMRPLLENWPATQVCALIGRVTLWFADRHSIH